MINQKDQYSSSDPDPDSGKITPTSNHERGAWFELIGLGIDHRSMERVLDLGTKLKPTPMKPFQGYVLIVLVLGHFAISGAKVQVADNIVNSNGPLDPQSHRRPHNETMSSQKQVFSLPPLEYPYDALEPYFDKETMEIHYTKHHQSYVNNSNKILEHLPRLQKYSAEQLITRLDEVPKDKRTGLRNNAGGHANHSMFWKGLKKGTKLQGSLRQAIGHTFGSVEEFQKIFEKAAASRFGSGWAWLIVKQDGSLAVVDTANQDSPLMGEEIAGCSGYPIIALDVWEHAYYLKFKNRRPDYIKTFWNVVNWDEASKRYSAIKEKVGRSRL